MCVCVCVYGDDLDYNVYNDDVWMCFQSLVGWPTNIKIILLYCYINIRVYDKIVAHNFVF